MKDLGCSRAAPGCCGVLGEREQLTRELPPTAEAAAVACAEVLGSFAQTPQGDSLTWAFVC